MIYVHLAVREAVHARKCYSSRRQHDLPGSFEPTRFAREEQFFEIPDLHIRLFQLAACVDGAARNDFLVIGHESRRPRFTSFHGVSGMSLSAAISGSQFAISSAIPRLLGSADDPVSPPTAC